MGNEDARIKYEEEEMAKNSIGSGIVDVGLGSFG